MFKNVRTQSSVIESNDHNQYIKNLFSINCSNSKFPEQQTPNFLIISHNNNRFERENFPKKKKIPLKTPTKNFLYLNFLIFIIIMLIK